MPCKKEKDQAARWDYQEQNPVWIIDSSTGVTLLKKILCKCLHWGTSDLLRPHTDVWLEVWGALGFTLPRVLCLWLLAPSEKLKQGHTSNSSILTLLWATCYSPHVFRVFPGGTRINENKTVPWSNLDFLCAGCLWCCGLMTRVETPGTGSVLKRFCLIFGPPFPAAGKTGLSSRAASLGRFSVGIFIKQPYC